MLNEDVDRYIALRRTLGYKLRKPARHLQAFARYAEERGETHVRAATVLAWVTAAGRTLDARAERLRHLILFARFLNAEDARHEVPTSNIFAVRKTRPVPYIYTPGEIARILDAAGELRRQRPNPLRRELYVTMFGLIAATGLRVSEAIALRLDDVWPDGVLHIRETKFCKSRLVPLHPTVVEALGRYSTSESVSPEAASICSRRCSFGRSARRTMNYTFTASSNEQTSRPVAPAGRASTTCAIPSRHERWSVWGRAGRGRPSLRRALDLPRPRRYPADLLVSAGDARDDDRYRRGCGDAGRERRRMTPLAPLITRFLREYMPRQRAIARRPATPMRAASSSCSSMPRSARGARPSRLFIEQLDAPLIVDFLAHIEQQRGNGAATRNLRLAAIRAFMRYVEHQAPSALAQIAQIEAIPVKRHDQKLIRHLTMDEVRAILNAPDLAKRSGVRDRAMLHLCFAGGLRVSELVGVLLENVSLGRTPSVMVKGKGRRERCLPLWKETARDLRAWLSMRGPMRAPELFVNAEGAAMTRAGFEYVLDKHVRTAAKTCASLQRPFRVASSAPA